MTQLVDHKHFNSRHWNASLEGDYLWSNVNFGEAVTEVMTPLTWSVIQFTLDDWVFIPGYPTVDQIGGFPYLNISVFATLFRLTSRSQDDLLKYMEATLYMPLPPDVKIPLIPLSLKERLNALVAALQVQRKQRRGLKELPDYLENNPKFFTESQQRIEDQKEKQGLLKLWHTSLRPHIKRGVWCVLGSVSHASETTMALRRDLENIVGPEDAQHLIANISDPGKVLPSLGPVIGLDKVARREWGRAEYLDKYGHRGPQEFELSVPRPAEDPTWLDHTLAQWRSSPSDIATRIAQQQANFKAAWGMLQKTNPAMAKSFKRRIEESAHQGRLREQARSAYVRDRWLVRLFAKRAAELTGIGEDIFFLSLDELLGTLRGKTVPSAVITARQKTCQEFKTLPAYPSVIRGPFDPLQWAADPERRSDFYLPEGITTEGDPSLIHGSPGSAGVVEGRVRRLTSPEEGLQPGEILLALQTDVAWTVLFPRAAAVITDIGAHLSHAAIVARELGIPAVVGCGNAMARLKTGDRVRVDGSRGIVRLMP